MSVLLSMIILWVHDSATINIMNSVCVCDSRHIIYLAHDNSQSTTHPHPEIQHTVLPYIPCI